MSFNARAVEKASRWLYEEETPAGATTWDELPECERECWRGEIEQKAGAYLEALFEEIGWPEIDAFHAELRKGQSVYEDAGSYFLRCIRGFFGGKIDEVVSYRQAARALIQEAASR